MSTKQVFNSETHGANVVERFKVLYAGNKFYDYTLIAGCDGIRIPVHRLVLYTCSGYFFDLFCNEGSVTSEKELPNVKGNALKKIVKFMYTGSITLGTEDIQSIWEGAQLLKLTTLEEKCIPLMLTAGNFLEIAFYAKKYSKSKLEQEALDLACRYFDSVGSSQEFLCLNEDQLCKLLAAYINANPHYGQMFYYLLQWYRHDKFNRKDLIGNLVSRFLRFESLQGMPVVLEWNLEPSKIFKLDKLFLLNYISNGSDLNVQVYNRLTNNWKSKSWPNPPHGQCAFSLLVFNGKCIISGGFQKNPNGHFASRLVQYLDLESMKWHELPPLLTQRYGHLMTTLNGYLYVIGGIHREYLSSVEKFDFATKTWQLVSPLPILAKYCKAGVLNHRLYVTDYDLLMTYDPNKNEWRKIMYSETFGIFAALEFQFKYKLVLFDITALNGSLYLAGKVKEETKIFEYNLEDNTAKELIRFKDKQISSHLNCITLNNRVVVIGKEYCTEYDPQKKEWKELAFIFPHPSNHLRKLYTNMVEYSSY